MPSLIKTQCIISIHVSENGHWHPQLVNGLIDTYRRPIRVRGDDGVENLEVTERMEQNSQGGSEFWGV
jgi:hypothetical protein